MTELPKRVKLFAIPRDVEIAGRQARCRATCRARGPRIEVVRELEDGTDDDVRPPEAATDFRPVGSAAAKGLRAPALYR